MRYGLVSSGAVRRVSRGRRSNVNAERDFGPGDAGEINAKANRGDYGYRLKAKNPFSTARWRPEWFSWQPMAWDNPPEPKGANVTGQSALDRARRGET
jgi:hypothetical protein